MVIGILLVLAILFLVGFAISGPMGAPWVPTFKRDVARVLDDAALKAGDVYIELGSGDGRLVAEAAKRGAHAVGYEINPVLWLFGSLRIIRFPKSHIHWRDFWQQDLSEADVVVTFLMPKFMARLERKVNQELKPGARLISYVYELPTKRPYLKRHHWRVYRF